MAETNWGAESSEAKDRGLWHGLEKGHRPSGDGRGVAWNLCAPFPGEARTAGDRLSSGEKRARRRARDIDGTQSGPRGDKELQRVLWTTGHGPRPDAWTALWVRASLSLGLDRSDWALACTGARRGQHSEVRFWAGEEDTSGTTWATEGLSAPPFPTGDASNPERSGCRGGPRDIMKTNSGPQRDEELQPGPWWGRQRT
ncbi:hypothetical protein NDU88_004535 [Pleurodeles waltl]|uniref:Uncharacterized protein n=1 Tax=Pleurodeles waltl TaxID=8319 RepID=A0AAV7RIJ7_PLEWA|nr:hypothetical protein NDU88_004535 [Pleurodeles waltl]